MTNDEDRDTPEQPRAEPFVEPDDDAPSSLPAEPRHQTRMREALFYLAKVEGGRAEAWREGHDEEPDVRMLELGMAQVEALAAIYDLLKERLPERPAEQE